MKVKNDWTTVASGKLERAQARLRKALGNDGAFVIEMLSGDDNFLGHAAEFLRNGGLIEPSSWQMARYIMSDRITGSDWISEGYNIFGPREWHMCFDDLMHYRAANMIGEFPWEPEILLGPCPFEPNKKVCDTHIAFLSSAWDLDVREMTVHDLQQMCPADNPHIKIQGPIVPTMRPIVSIERTLSLVDEVHDKELLENAHETSLEPRWYLMPKAIFQVQEGADFEKLRRHLPEDYEVANAVEEVARRVLLARTSGGPNELDPYETPVWCREVNGDHQRIVVIGHDRSRHERVGGCFGGNFVEERVEIEVTAYNDRPGNQVVPDIGLALSRIPGM